MAQVTMLSDETQSVTITVTPEYPILYSGDEQLRKALLAIGDLHTAEPIDTLVFDSDTDPYVSKLTVTLIDTRVAVYHFETVTPVTALFTIAFTGGTWEETSLDLLVKVKDAILELNDTFVMSGSDSLSWESA